MPIEKRDVTFQSGETFGAAPRGSTGDSDARPCRMICVPDLVPPRQFAFGAFRLSPDQRLVEKSGVPLQLGGRAMDILIALVERAGKVLSQKELIDIVWPDVNVVDGNLRYHVRTLRKALDDGVEGARYIINVPGRGYCFVCPVTPTHGGEAQTPTPTASPEPTHGAPSRLDRMEWREIEVEAVAAQLSSCRLVTLVGPGGVGKTTVAVSVGHVVARAYGDLCFVELGPLRDPRLVASALAAALGVEVPSEDQIAS